MTTDEKIKDLQYLNLGFGIVLQSLIYQQFVPEHEKMSRQGFIEAVTAFTETNYSSQTVNAVKSILTSPKFSLSFLDVSDEVH